MREHHVAGALVRGFHGVACLGQHGELGRVAVEHGERVEDVERAEDVQRLEAGEEEYTIADWFGAVDV